MKNNYWLFIFASLFIFNSCQDDNDGDGNETTGIFQEGIYVANEGSFGSGNGSITYIGQDTVIQNAFETVNNRPLGDVVQSIAFHNGKAYIVVNNSNKVEVVDANTFEEIATITDLGLPRYFMGVNEEKAYVSQWGVDGASGSIAVIDLISNTVTETISTGGVGPERMRVINDRIYVGNSGGYLTDDMVSVIDPFNDNLITTINTGINPGEIIQDIDGNVWVLCAGFYDWNTGENTNGRLSQIDPASGNILKDFELPGNYPGDLNINFTGDVLYFAFNGDIVAQDINESTLNLTPVLSGANYYSLGYDEDQDRFLAGDAKDFVSQGEMFILDGNGTALESHIVGINPGDFTIRN